MAEFSFIKFNGVRRTDGYYGKYDNEDDFISYINNDHIMAFRECLSSGETAIEMVDGTTYFINKPLAKVMSEFGKIQYTV